MTKIPISTRKEGDDRGDQGGREEGAGCKRDNYVGRWLSSYSTELMPSRFPRNVLTIYVNLARCTLHNVTCGDRGYSLDPHRFYKEASRSPIPIPVIRYRGTTSRHFFASRSSQESPFVVGHKVIIPLRNAKGTIDKACTMGVGKTIIYEELGPLSFRIRKEQFAKMTFRKNEQRDSRSD